MAQSLAVSRSRSSPIKGSVMGHGSVGLCWGRHPSLGATAIPRLSTMRLGQALSGGLRCWVGRVSRRLKRMEGLRYGEHYKWTERA